ncbi:MAG: release factor glutamine methyltransferase [Candidatus Parcubacteria bacterium]|jgi:HemK-like putative methylase
MKFEDKVKLLREKKYKGRETEQLLADIKKMTEGESVEYLLGEVTFCGVKVDLSLRPMIPRPETEYWVKQAIDAICHCESKYTLRVLDLFSGSGNVGLSILKHVPEASIDMIELDPKLKEQIELSIVKNNIKRTRARVVTGDTWTGAIGTYDYIMAVPPYVPPHMKEEVMKELHAEDPLCFFDKEDGFYYHKQVLSHARDFLKHDGVLYLEFDITQRLRIEELAKEYRWRDITFLNDPYGSECVMVCKV